MCVRVCLCACSTEAFLSVGQERRYDHDASLPNTHALQPLVHAGDQVSLTHVRVIGFVLRVAEGMRVTKRLGVT